jgi:dienelactone hydrolase
MGGQRGADDRYSAVRLRGSKFMAVNLTVVDMERQLSVPATVLVFGRIRHEAIINDPPVFLIILMMGLGMDFAAEMFTHDAITHQVFRKGRGPAVIVISEMPGISRQLLGFADRVVALGGTAVLPDLFGRAGGDVLTAGLTERVAGMWTMVGACLSREFTVLATGRSSPVTAWLRALANREHQRCGGPGVGVVGMCFTGGFALAMAVDPVVIAPVLAEPSLPFALSRSRKHSIDCSDRDPPRPDREASGPGRAPHRAGSPVDGGLPGLLPELFRQLDGAS